MEASSMLKFHLRTELIREAINNPLTGEIGDLVKG